ncbi:MAG: ATP-binding cassette domain-containing protein [Burkholderiaceae bacterium]
MIRIRDITLARGGVPLLERASATINPGEKLSLVGLNGSGKSSLMAAFAGELLLEAGDIDIPPGRIVKLEQSLPGGDAIAWQHVLAADAALMDAARQRDEAEAVGGMALAEALDAWAQLGGHSASARIGELLAGLGFTPAQIASPVATLSGGWRMRLNLARALFAPSELLLLDEPTNHLDLDAIVWLERWLLRYPGTAIVISHDRDFLDRVADATLSIEDRKLVRYAGGYSAFETLRAQRLDQAQRAATQQAARIADLTRFIDRFRAKATKARQVQSRIKALEKMARVAPLRAASAVDFTLAPATDAPDPLIVAEGLDAGYDAAAPILRGVDLLVAKGARIGLLGRNGAGKSTLIRTLIGDLPALGGECRAARAMRIGYFAQHGVEGFRADESPLAMYRRLWPEPPESAHRAELGRYGFSGDDALRPIGPMSGGEKARLLLGMILRGKPHLLVLDEPTNHLDAQTRDSLTEALADFDGALLLVSHDRYLMRATVDQLALVHDGRLEPFDGDLDDYLGWLQSAAAAGPAAPAGAAGSAAGPVGPAGSGSAPGERREDRKEQRRLDAQRRAELAARVKPLDQRIRRIEQELTAVEAELTELEHRFADPALYERAGEAAELARRRGELGQRRDELENDWLSLSEERERASQV